MKRGKLKKKMVFYYEQNWEIDPLSDYQMKDLLNILHKKQSKKKVEKIKRNNSNKIFSISNGL